MTGRRTAAALLASLLLASPALAQSRVTERDRQAANELVKKAIVKSDADEHIAAIDLYRQAYAIVPNPVLLTNIGFEFEKAGKPVEALRYFCVYLEKDPNGSLVSYATSRARALQIKLGNDNLDERDVCVVPRPDRREPRRTDPAPEPPEEPREPRPPPPKEPAPPRQTDSLKYGAVVSGLAGVAAVAVGAYAGVRAGAISDEISSHDRTRPWPSDIRDTERRGQVFENIQIGGLVAGGALITTATILYVVSRSKSSEASDSAVTLAPTTNGVVVFGWF